MKTVKKPWGKEIWFAYNNKKYVGKLIIIKKGHRLSKQYHKRKHETLYTDHGRYIMEFKNRKRIVRQGETIVLPPGRIHRRYAKFCDVRLIEVSTPELTDVVRIEDDYGRIN